LGLSLSPASPQPPGRLITFDGIDGTGKSTQIARLAETLRAGGHEVLVVRDPGSTEIGTKLRALLLDSTLHLHRRTEAMLFMASRCEMIEAVIRPALKLGTIVLSDRFLLANVVYQSVGGRESPETLWTMGRLACGGLEPDLTLLLDMPAEQAMARIDRAADRMESRGLDYMTAVRDAFRRELKNAGGSGVVIDAADTPDAVAAAILTAVTEHGIASPAAD